MSFKTLRNWVRCLFVRWQVVVGSAVGVIQASVYITRLLSSHEIWDHADRQHEQSERIGDFTGLILSGAAAVSVLRFIHAISVRESALCLIFVAVTLTASHINLKATTP